MKLKINRKHQEFTDDFELEFYRTVLSCTRLVKKINIYAKESTPPPEEYQTDLGCIYYTGYDINIRINDKVLYITEQDITVFLADNLSENEGFKTTLTKGDVFDRTSRMVVKDFINRNPDVIYIVLRMPQVLKIMINEFFDKDPQTTH